MADYIDNTVDNEVDVNQVVLDRILQADKLVVESNHFCEKCDDDIPEARRKLKNVTLCVLCQTDLEKKQKLNQVMI